ncbi:esterase/lipase family protein [Tahibacter amnicola]|uniref:Alpha/beta hydrolase n=1 Tax=Tahibacter amnicola TaxID=2976241 RepID=A0ABY6BFB3_9GAMM|nr:alpha/beta hydrolase [Tahibacter amnicola]UXI67045.1 alpha/beta hydrolase [Tahibacter amnicola]
MDRPLPLQPPTWLSTIGELRCLFDLASRAWPTARPVRCGRGEPVLVIPGFGTGDSATCLLRHRLRQAGYTVYRWRLGLNAGPRGEAMHHLSARIRQIARHSGRPVHLVGWSLGGLMARVVAARLPRQVHRVIALGSPLTADPRSSRLSGLLSLVCGKHADDREVRAMVRRSARVPVISIFSRSDGVVAWEASAQAPGDCIAHCVEGSHLGLVINPRVHDLVAQALAHAAPAH